MPDPDWNDFKIVLALARGGSVAGAAREIAVDSSTISRRLAALEDSLGARLIVRGGQKFAWTAEGRAVLVAAEAIAAAALEAARAVRSAKVDTAAPVIVSCAPGLSATLTRMLAAVKEKRPELTVQLRAENRAVDLATGEADIAVRMFRPSDPDLICRQAFEMGWAVYASADYLAEHGAPASFAELAEHHLVRYVSAMHKVAGPRWLEDHRGAAAASVQVDNTEVAAHVVASGGGISVLPCAVAEVRKDMQRVFPDPVAFNTGWLVYHESARDSARVRAAVDVLTEVLDADRDFLSGRNASRPD